MSFKAFIQIASVIIAVACIALIGYFALSYKNMADYMDEANLAINSEDYNRAAEILEGIISREVSNESAHRKLAAIYEQKGQPGTAVYYWRNVAKLNPLDRDVVLKIAENLLACRRYDEVVELLKPYLDSQKITTQEKICLCKAFLYNGQRKLAEPVIAEMLAAEPDNISALLLKANIKRRKIFTQGRIGGHPAVENQATDRAFRIGQKKNVMVHKFVTQGTIEEKIDRMLEQKSSMSREIIAPTGEQWITEMSNEELMNLFTLGSS